MGYTQIIGESLKDISGEPLNGWVTFTGPVDETGDPLSVVACGGPLLFSRKKFLVVAGIIVGEFSNPQLPARVADTTQGNPENFGYTVEFFDRQLGKIKRPGYLCVQPSGGSWSLDTYSSPQPALGLVTSGPPGESAYQLAVEAGFTGTLQQWLASLVGAPGEAAPPSLPLTAHASISALFAVANTSAGAVQADASDKTKPAIGIATAGAIAGASVPVQYSGPLTNPGWNWTPGQPIFVGANGALTQAAPSSGFIQALGRAITATEILIAVDEPIFID